MKNYERNTYDERGLLNIYCNELNAFPPLKENKLKSLLRRAKKGDIEARNQIATSFLRLIPHLIKSYNLSEGARRRRIPVADLYSEGNMELLRLINRFDKGKNVTFKYFATFSLTKYLMGQMYRIYRNIPQYLDTDLKKIKTLESMLKSEGKRITYSDIRKHNGIHRYAADAYKFRVIREADINFEDYEGLESIIEYQQEYEHDADRNFMIKNLSQALDKLDKRSSLIIKWRYGLGDRRPRKLRELGDKLGLSKERIRQIQRKAEIEIKYAMKRVNNK